jgi:hypothetical protein
VPSATRPHLVLVTQPTALEELTARHSTADQARFRLRQQGIDFAPYQDAHDAYHRAVALVKAGVPESARVRPIDRQYLPTVLFGPDDVVAVVGRDGLVVNAAKYLHGQPVVGFNPDPGRIDGVLLPFRPERAGPVLAAVWAGRYAADKLTMARASLNTGQTLDAVNDLFVGRRGHASARYALRLGEVEEQQSSSGIIVSTGAGSTGWLRAVLAGAAGWVADAEAKNLRTGYAFPRTDRRLRFAVREPFPSRATAAGLVGGWLADGQTLTITSQMPQDGILFGDGVEADALEFVSGTVATVGVSDRALTLVTRAG